MTETTRWIVDSCPCVLIFDKNGFVFERFEARCDEHKLLDGQALFDGVRTHCASFNSQHTLPPMASDEAKEQEKLRIGGLKGTERARIESNGPTERRDSDNRP